MKLARQRPAKPPQRRHHRWPQVAQLHLALHPRCEACGGTAHREVHHLIPISYDPAKELDPANLLTLCDHPEAAISCHLAIGHLGDWTLYNARAVETCTALRAEVAAALLRKRAKR